MSKLFASVLRPEKSNMCNVDAFFIKKILNTEFQIVSVPANFLRTHVF
jgi:hypothetical protein